MTKAEQRAAAQLLRRVVERIDQGEVEAPAWHRERLVGAMLALDQRGWQDDELAVACRGCRT